MAGLGLEMGRLLGEFVKPETTEEKLGLVWVRCGMRDDPGSSSLAFIELNCSRLRVRSRILLESFSFSDLSVYKVPIKDGISNCCACSRIHFDKWVQELSRRSSKALVSSSE